MLTSRVDTFTTTMNGFRLNTVNSVRLCFTLIHGGYYDLRVYDIEQDGSVFVAEPAFQAVVFVQGPMTMSRKCSCDVPFIEDL